MQPTLPAAALALTVLVAGCLAPEPQAAPRLPPGHEGGPGGAGGTGGTAGTNATGPGNGTAGNATGGNTTGNQTAGNATDPGGNATGNMTTSPHPQVVVNQTFTWGVQPPPAATFQVPTNYTNLTVNATSQGALAGQITIELVDPLGTSRGEETLLAAVPPAVRSEATWEVNAIAGTWTLRFGGQGTGTVHVLGMVSVAAAPAPPGP